MRLIIRDDSHAASSYVANYIVDRIKHFNPTADRPFVLGLPTGSSPLGVYKILVEKYKAGEVSFRNVVTFNMDEYIGIPEDHPQSYHSFMWKHLFSHIDVDSTNVHILNGNAPDLEAECVAYEAAIKKVGGIELFLAGIGADGHIAFNEPGSSLASRTRVKTLAYDTILANCRFFDNDLDKVPKMALTVGVQTILEAREVVAIVLGAKKAIALQRCIEQGVNHMWTLSSLQLHPNPMIVCDEDATLELQVKTVKYFKSIEKVALAAGFEQIPPSTMRMGKHMQMLFTNGTSTDASHATVPGLPQTVVSKSESPTIFSPPPMVSHLLNPTVSANGHRVRSVSAEQGRDRESDLAPDRMANRITGGDGRDQQQQQKDDNNDFVPDRMADRIPEADTLGIRRRLSPTPACRQVPEAGS